MTSQQDLTNLLNKHSIDSYVFHYFSVADDVMDIIKMVRNTGMRYNICMIMGEHNANHWILIVNLPDHSMYYFDSYGVWPGAYNYRFSKLSQEEIKDIRKNHMKRLIASLKKEKIKLTYNDFIFQNNLYGTVQGDYDPEKTSTCGHFCVFTAILIEENLNDEVLRRLPIDKHVITLYNLEQASRTLNNGVYFSYDDVVQRL